MTVLPRGRLKGKRFIPKEWGGGGSLRERILPSNSWGGRGWQGEILEFHTYTVSMADSASCMAR